MPYINKMNKRLLPLVAIIGSLLPTTLNSHQSMDEQLSRYDKALPCTTEIKKESFYGGIWDLAFHKTNNVLCMRARSNWFLSGTLDAIEEEYKEYQKAYKFDTKEVGNTIRFIRRKSKDANRLKIELRYQQGEKVGHLLVFNYLNEPSNKLLGATTVNKRTILGLMYATEKEHMDKPNFMTSYFKE
jgi:hypothetical protein